MYNYTQTDTTPSPQNINPLTFLLCYIYPLVIINTAKLRLDEALLPLALPPDLADSVLTGIRAAPVSILLHGPPGCGKTKLAKAVAGEANAALLSVGPSDILSKFVGESEASITVYSVRHA